MPKSQRQCATTAYGNKRKLQLNNLQGSNNKYQNLENCHLAKQSKTPRLQEQKFVFNRREQPTSSTKYTDTNYNPEFNNDRQLKTSS